MSVPSDLRSLKLLADVARLGSIGAAGRAAGVSQQSASERLRALEAETRLVLVQRAPRGSALTPAGQLLVEWTRDLLARADEVDIALATLRRDQSQELHVYASMTTAEFLLPRWLVQLRHRRRISVSLRAVNSADVILALRHRQADLGFVEGPIDVGGLSTTVVGTDELVMVAAPDDRWSRRRKPITPADIANRRLTCREPGSGTRAVVEDALRNAGTRLAEPDVELATNTAILAAVRAGGSPALVSRRSAAADLLMKTVVEVAIADLDFSREFRAVWVGGTRLPAGPSRELLDIARADQQP